MNMSFEQQELDPSALRHPDSVKWTEFPPDVLPLWIADMDFPVAPSILAVLSERLQRGLGYAPVNARSPLSHLLRAKLENQGIVGLPEQGWIGYFSGVVQGLYATVLGLSSPGDDVITTIPVYPPFLSAITDHGRNLRAAALAQTSDGWAIDWTALEQAVTPASRVLMLCHPHNPTGRVWTRAELLKLAEFAMAHRLWIVCDELHADLTLDGPFLPFAGVAPREVLSRTITLTGPCKAYNTAGLGIGAMVSHNPDLIARVKKAVVGVSGHPNALSATMWHAALQDDGAWLASTLRTLRDNRDLLARFVRERLTYARFTPPQGTYLAWLDCRAHPRAADIQQYFLETAKVALADGPMFGNGYQGFVRLNFATTRPILTEALERLAGATG